MSIATELLKYRLADHTADLGYAELGQDGSGDISELRARRPDVAVAEKDAWNQVRRDAVITDPALRIVIDQRPGRRAERGLPRSAVALAEADKQIRCVLEIAALEDDVREVY